MIDCYEKMTIGTYQEVQAILNSTEDDMEIKTELVALLNNMEVDDVLELPLTTFNHLLQGIGFLFEMPKTRQVLTKYKLGGMELETMTDIHNMTAGQFIDYQTFIKDTEKYTVELLSIFLIPKGKKYNDGYDIIEVQNIIRDNLSIVDAISLSAFFLEWYKSLSMATLNCLKKKMKKMLKKERNQEAKAKMEEALILLEKSGDGLQWLIEYQKQYGILGKE